MELDDRMLAFLEKQSATVMTTLKSDGTPHSVRVASASVDGKIWSSGTATRVRTRHLRRDPRCALIVLDQGAGHLSLETTVTIHDGPDAPELNVRYFRLVQKRPTGPLSWLNDELDEAAFRKAMVDEQRLIYEFEVHRAFGIY